MMGETRRDPVLTRTLGRGGTEVSALGLGCWAIGGPYQRDGRPVGWVDVDDNESVRAVRRALEMGVTFFDTADVYGCGHSERVLGRALSGRHDEVTIATKFGNVFDEAARRVTGADASPEYVRRACEASLERLGTDRIDLYQLHLGDLDPAEAEPVHDALEDLVAEGKIRSYGWSTDGPDRARLFAGGPNCAAIQQRLNLFEGIAHTLAVCEEEDLASVNRGPLGKRLLTGKFDASSKLPENDVRAGWDFSQGTWPSNSRSCRNIRDALTADGRTLAQGSLGWLWSRSANTIPIPGFKTVEQVEENAGPWASARYRKNRWRGFGSSRGRNDLTRNTPAR